MKKNSLYILLSMFLVLLTVTGCSNSEKGYYSSWGVDALGNKRIRIVHVDTSDNGGYLLKSGSCKYKIESSSGGWFSGELSAGPYDGPHDKILNANEVFNKVNKGYYTTHKWNGQTIKISRTYVFEDDFKDSPIEKVPKDALGFKDGKLILNGTTYEKTDKDKLEKEYGKMKDELKAMLGKKFTTGVLHSEGKNMQAVFSQIVIIRDGKTEIFK